MGATFDAKVEVREDLYLGDHGARPVRFVASGAGRTMSEAVAKALQVGIKAGVLDDDEVHARVRKLLGEALTAMENEKVEMSLAIQRTLNAAARALGIDVPDPEAPTFVDET